MSLTDARPGQELLLVHFEHHAVESPYRAGFAIYVAEGEQTYDRRDAVPEQLGKRSLALRAYDARGMLIAFQLCEGRALEASIEAQFANAAAAYLHVHFAAPGCYAALVERA